jgi:hypothetical protein
MIEVYDVRWGDEGCCILIVLDTQFEGRKEEREMIPEEQRHMKK